MEANLTRPAAADATTESCSTSVYISKGGMSACGRGAEHGVGDVAHAGLQRQEPFGDAACRDFARQEFGDVLADLLGHRVRRAEATGSSSSSVSTTPTIFEGSTLMSGEPMRSETE